MCDLRFGSRIWVALWLSVWRLLSSVLVESWYSAVLGESAWSMVWSLGAWHGLDRESAYDSRFGRGLGLLRGWWLGG